MAEEALNISESVDADELITVADDNGYADHKICYWEGKGDDRHIVEKVIPSRLTLGRDNVDIHGDGGVYQLNGEEWSVAPDVSNPVENRTDRYATSDMNTILVHHVLRTNNLAGKPLRLITGLPLKYYYKQQMNGVNKELHKQIVASVAREVTAIDGSPGPDIREHLIFPEAICAAIDYMVDDRGQMANEPRLGIGIVDIGGQTTDVSRVTADFQCKLTSSRTMEQGVLNVRQALKDLIVSETGLKEQAVRADMLQSALVSGKYLAFGEDMDVSELVTRAKRTVIALLRDFVYELLADGSDMDKVLFVGGGAELLSELAAEFHNGYVPPGARFANARGMLKYATLT